MQKLGALHEAQLQQQCQEIRDLQQSRQTEHELALQSTEKQYQADLQAADEQLRANLQAAEWAYDRQVQEAYRVHELSGAILQEQKLQTTTQQQKAFEKDKETLQGHLQLIEASLQLRAAQTSATDQLPEHPPLQLPVQGQGTAASSQQPGPQQPRTRPPAHVLQALQANLQLNLQR